MIQHIAFIMDGNRRYASERDWPVFKGHYEGALRAQDVIKWTIEASIPYLSLFAFSQENLLRSKDEVNYLWDLIANTFLDAVAFFQDHNIKLVFIGEKEAWPLEHRSTLIDLQNCTNANTGMTLIVGLCYSGQWDVDQAVSHFALNQDGNWQKFLKTAPFPNPDLLIRTGKEKRISNYYLYSLAYTELFFLDVYWPQITKEIFDEIIANYYQRDRRFGKNSKYNNEKEKC